MSTFFNTDSINNLFKVKKAKVNTENNEVKTENNSQKTTLM